MNKTYKLVELVKQKHGVTSDYAVGKICGFSNQKISEWKRGIAEGNAENTLKLVVAAGLSATDALHIMTERPATAGGITDRRVKQCILC